jgi:hypothetical protein
MKSILALSALTFLGFAADSHSRVELNIGFIEDYMRANLLQVLDHATKKPFEDILLEEVGASLKDT